jgi:hypothetical protein
MIIFGTRPYGVVDQVPGVIHVATDFLHVNYIPLLPTGSCLYIDPKLTDGEALAVKIGWNVKSILIGWVRSALMLATIGLGFVTIMMATKAPPNTPPWAALGPLTAAVVSGLLWWLSHRVTRASAQRAYQLCEPIDPESILKPHLDAYFTQQAPATPATTVASWQPKPSAKKEEDDVFRLE